MLNHVNKHQPRRSPLRILRTGDPQSMFHHFTPNEVLVRLGRPKQLLSSSAKTDKSRKVSVLSRVLYLSPGVYCPRAEACLEVCLGHASGLMTMLSSANARDRRTALYAADQEHFFDLLRCDLRRLREDARSAGMTPAARLNGTSDIPFERLHPEVFSEFGDVQFYDYTKLGSRVRACLRRREGTGVFPDNYHLTFSLSETNRAEARSLLEAGAGVAVVFWPTSPETFWGRPTVNGDLHDARFLDPEGSVIGLSAKGVAREDLSGFVVKTTGEPVKRLHRGAA